MGTCEKLVFQKKIVTQSHMGKNFCDSIASVTPEMLVSRYVGRAGLPFGCVQGNKSTHRRVLNMKKKHENLSFQNIYIYSRKQYFKYNYAV